MEKSAAVAVFSPDQTVAVWKAVLLNLGEVRKGEFGRAEATALAERMARSVPKPALQQNQALLLGALRATFAALPPAPVHAALLDIYTGVRADITDFLDQRFGFAALVGLLLSPSEEIRTAAREAIARIERAARDAPIAHAIGEHVDEVQLANIALEIVNGAEGIDDEWLKIVGDLFDALVEVQGKEAVEFRLALVKLLVEAALTAKGRDSAILSELLHKVYQ
jgi:hypothetical protein